MIPAPDTILEHESIRSVLPPKFEDSHTWMLPVVDKEGHYLGFISKSRILNSYPANSWSRFRSSGAADER